MAEKTKNLCAQLPESLHAKVRQRQEESGKTLSEYITALITEFYEKEGKSVAKGNIRTVAFQMDADLFERFKEFLKEKGLSQKDFFMDCINQALGINQETT